MNASDTRLIPVSRHERFWLDVIRAASCDADPEPTLWRTQQLRLLFADEGRHAGGKGGLAALLGAAPGPSCAGSLPHPRPD